MRVGVVADRVTGGGHLAQERRAARARSGRCVKNVALTPCLSSSSRSCGRPGGVRPVVEGERHQLALPGRADERLAEALGLRARSRCRRSSRRRPRAAPAASGHFLMSCLPSSSSVERRDGRRRPRPRRAPEADRCRRRRGRRRRDGACAGTSGGRAARRGRSARRGRARPASIHRWRRSGSASPAAQRRERRRGRSRAPMPT